MPAAAPSSPALAPGRPRRAASTAARLAPCGARGRRTPLPSWAAAGSVRARATAGRRRSVRTGVRRAVPPAAPRPRLRGTNPSSAARAGAAGATAVAAGAARSGVYGGPRPAVLATFRRTRAATSGKGWQPTSTHVWRAGGAAVSLRSPSPSPASTPSRGRTLHGRNLVQACPRVSLCSRGRGPTPPPIPPSSRSRCPCWRCWCSASRSCSCATRWPTS
jgi:hypothetical protein